MTKSLNLILTKSGVGTTSLILELKDSQLVEAVIAALKLGPLEALQVRWSGNGFVILLGDSFTMPSMDKETETASNFKRGDVLCYKVEQGELIFAYGDVGVFDGDVPLYCYQIGRVTESSLGDLEKVGNSIHRDGVRVVNVYS